MGVFSIFFLFHAFQFNVISIFHWNAPEFCAQVINANSKLAVFRMILEDPYFQLCPAWGSLRVVTNVSASKNVHGPAASLARMKVWKAEQPLPCGCSAAPAFPHQVSSCLSSGVLLFEGEILNFCLFCWAGLCSLPPAPVANLPLARFSLPINPLFQLNCHWGGTIVRLYTDLVSVNFCSLWTCLVKFMM